MVTLALLVILTILPTQGSGAVWVPHIGNPFGRYIVRVNGRLELIIFAEPLLMPSDIGIAPGIATLLAGSDNTRLSPRIIPGWAPPAPPVNDILSPPTSDGNHRTFIARTLYSEYIENALFQSTAVVCWSTGYVNAKSVAIVDCSSPLVLNHITRVLVLL